MKKSYIVKVADWVSEMKKVELCEEKGVYFIFAASPAEKTGNYPRSTLHELLYIGRSKGVNDRINGQHHRHEDILNSCKKYKNARPVYFYGEVLSENGADCTKDDIIRVESALIFSKQPTLNATADKKFHHDDTSITLMRASDTINKNADGSLKPLPPAFKGDSVLVKKDDEA